MWMASANGVHADLREIALDGSSAHCPLWR
jgi:hypothetical protein